MHVHTRVRGNTPVEVDTGDLVDAVALLSVFVGERGDGAASGVEL
ncbi:MAG: hypothetical protein QXG03_00400 [Halalkalicoccus sp.]